MEPDRYEQNHTGYIVGLVCLVVSLTLFGMGAYILPRIAFGWYYNIPGFIFEWISITQIAYSLSEKAAGWLILGVFFVLAFIFAGITYVTSNKIETQIYAVDEPVIEVKKETSKKEIKETGPLVLKILLLVGFIFTVAKMFQWAISTSNS